MTLSARARSLALGLVVAIALQLSLTPIGQLETRSLAQTTPIGQSTVVVFLVGLALQIAAIWALFRRPRTAPMLALIGLPLYFPIFLADITGLWSSKPAPPVITYLSILTAIVVIGSLFLATRLYRENAAKAPNVA